jgi:hypothetical protein
MMAADIDEVHEHAHLGDDVVVYGKMGRCGSMYVG